MVLCMMIIKRWLRHIGTRAVDSDDEVVVVVVDDVFVVVVFVLLLLLLLLLLLRLHFNFKLQT
jgi:hypothetical protein